MIFFDYLYFRLAKLYFRTDGTDSKAPVFIISLVQVLLILDVTTVFYFKAFEFLVLESNSDWAKIGFILMYFLFSYLNYYRYKNKFHVLKEKWDEQSKKSKIITDVLISLLFVFLMVLPGIVLNMHSPG